MAAFVLVFGIAMLITITGLSLVAVRRAEGRVQSNMMQNTQAQYVALAGVEYALGHLAATSNWRSTLSNGNWFDMNFGRGRFVVSGIDTDGSLSNDETDPVTITSRGTVENAVSNLSVTVAPRKHQALRYACFADGTLDFRTNCVIRGPVRTNGSILSDGTVSTQDNASYDAVNGSNVNLQLQPVRLYSTALSYPAPKRADYLAMATPINGDVSYSVELRKYVLTPTRNSEWPYTVNANGIYSLNAGGRDVIIENTHIKGTLIIYNTSRKVLFQRSCWIEPASQSYPTLLIYTNGADVEFDVDAAMAEGYLGKDMNEDGDTADSFPSIIKGVVWTQNSYIYFHKSNASLYGCMIGNYIRIAELATVNEDPSLADAYMPGFLDTDMQIVQGSWREVQP